MNTVTSNPFFNARMSDKDFERLSSFIYNEYGIKLPMVKKVMLESRLHKRLKEVNLSNFTQYIDYVFSPHGMETELIHMIDVVTTNKTDFFREPHHFEFLQQYVLPEFSEETRNRRHFKIWSSASSSGEEPYTLSMVLSDYAEKSPSFDYSMFATDISTRILAKAINAVYDEDRIVGIPNLYKKKYLLKSKDREHPTVRIIPELRKKVNFQRFNLMDERYNVTEEFDVVFCRNVIIYFDRETQEKVIQKLCSKLKKGGYFFLGHSESITNMDVPLQHIKPTIFRKI